MTLLPMIVLLASELPDPGRLSTVTFAGTFGTATGALVAHLRNLPPEEAGKAMRTGLLVGFGLGMLCWAGSFAAYLL